MEPTPHLLERVVSSLGDVVLVIDSSTRTIVDCNPAAERVLGYTADELIGQRTEMLYPDRQGFDAFAAQGEPVLEAGGVFRTEGRMRRKDGTIIDTEHTVTSIDEDIGWRGGVVSVIRDITDRRRSEEALRERERQYRLLTDNTVDVIWAMDMDLVFTYVNPAVTRLTGFTPEEYVGSRLADHCSEAVLEQLLGLLEQTIARGPDDRGVVVQIDLRRKDVPTVPVEVHARVVYDDAGTPTGVQGTTRDISERRTLERQLIQAQKMESVGRLAGGVAHDFNNMLSIILGNAELALDELDPSSPLHGHLQEILKASQRSADLTRQLLAFARRQTIAPKVLDLDETVASMLKMLGRMIGEDIDLVWKPDGDLWLIRVDPAQIDQVLANLVVNARDAIDGVGTVTIETRRVTLDAAFCAGHPGAVLGEYVRLAVSDDGAGMDEETLTRVFEPFFTTKPQGKGTGLGLPMVYGIVKQNQGYITVDSEPGGGTTVRIYFPRFAEAQGPGEGPDEPSRAETGTETVLLVEDEVSLLTLAERLLARLGYTVLTASSAEQARAVVREHAAPIDLLATDVVMPGISGRDLWRELALLRPGLRCLFMSGYTADVIARRGVLDDDVVFLQKPFTAQSLAAKVREALRA